MADLDIDALLTPVSAERPSGADLVYDSEFTALETAARGREEAQFGDRIFAAQPPDWRAVEAHAAGLLRRTRDLRVAVLWLRAGTRLHGVTAFADGIALVHGLLQRHWDTLHPELDEIDGNDPTMRINALAALAHAPTVPADLRAASLSGARGSITARQVELAFGRIDPAPGESAATREGAVQGLKEAAAKVPGLLDRLRAAGQHVGGIQELLRAKVGVLMAPDLTLLKSIVDSLVAAAHAADGAAALPDPASSATASGRTVATAPGTIGSRSDAMRALDSVCQWIDQNEPTNPAPLLIRRAKRLMGKSFIDIIRDLAPDGLSQVEGIAGVEGKREQS